MELRDMSDISVILTPGISFWNDFERYIAGNAYSLMPPSSRYESGMRSNR